MVSREEAEENARNSRPEALEHVPEKWRLRLSQPPPRDPRDMRALLKDSWRGRPWLNETLMSLALLLLLVVGAALIFRASEGYHTAAAVLTAFLAAPGLWFLVVSVTKASRRMRLLCRGGS